MESLHAMIKRSDLILQSLGRSEAFEKRGSKHICILDRQLFSVHTGDGILVLQVRGERED